MAGQSAIMGQSAPAPWTFWAYFALTGAARVHDFAEPYHCREQGCLALVYTICGG